MKYLVDTNVFIDCLKGKKAANDFLKSNLESVYYSVITYTEILAGATDRELPTIIGLMSIIIFLLRKMPESFKENILKAIIWELPMQL
jgi:predicted nucleic acid-binding protein